MNQFKLKSIKGSIVILPFVLMNFFAFGQKTVSGYITDDNSGEPVYGQ
jgi:hypothetical protein